MAVSHHQAKFGIFAHINVLTVVSVLLATLVLTGAAFGQAVPWNGFARDAQHTAQSLTPSQALNQIRWRTPVDLAPQYSSNGELLIHYGSPLVTAANTVILPVKTGATNGFQVEAINGTNGNFLWTVTTDYILPSHDWTPVFGPTLAPGPLLYFPGAGGTVFSRTNPDSASGAVERIAFYGTSLYSANAAAYNLSVMIDTPITADSSGNIYFGFLVTGATPGTTMESGIARISASGQGTWIAASSAANDSTITEVEYNCAPAVSLDGTAIYVAVTNGNSGYLVELNSTTLAPIASVRLLDPESGDEAWMDNDSSASPTVGPDGDVYFGVLETPVPENHYRGWLLHFNSTLSQTKTPGSFGWDDTVSVVPSSMVPSYAGTSTYLLMTKYNDYADPGANGTGENKIAVLDPNATATDPVNGATVMHEVLTILGLTPNPPLPGVKEWCINSAAVDVSNKSILANSEDGKLYRWDLTSNTFTQSVVLTAGLGEAYTPTVIGVDGTVYAINNATLFAVGLSNGVSADFSISSPPPVTISSPGGSSASIPLVITAEGGYSGTIDFDSSSCSISPAGSQSSCSFSANSVTGSGGTMVTINTTAPEAMMLPPGNRPGVFEWKMLGLLAAVVAGFLGFAAPMKQARSKARLGFQIAILLATSVACIGCGGNSTTTASEMTTTGTPVGVLFTVTVTATAIAGGPSHSASFTFAVQ